MLFQVIEPSSFARVFPVIHSNPCLSRFHRRKQEPETAEEIDADIELILGRRGGGAPAATRLQFGTSSDRDSDAGSEADVTVRPEGDDDSEGEVAQDLLMDTDEE